MVSPMPSHWLGGVFHLLSRVEGLFELTKATWLVHALFPEPDLLIPTLVALFPVPSPSPSVTILTLTRPAPTGSMIGKYGKLVQLLSPTSNKREFLLRLPLDLALIISDSLSFQLRVHLPGMSFDYFDFLVSSYLPVDEPCSPPF